MLWLTSASSLCLNCEKHNSGPNAIDPGQFLSLYGSFLRLPLHGQLIRNMGLSLKILQLKMQERKCLVSKKNQGALQKQFQESSHAWSSKLEAH